MRKSITSRKHTKLHRKKSNVRKSRSFKKRRNAMRGGNFDELIKFLTTNEETVLHDHVSKSTEVAKIDLTNIFNKFNSKEITKDELFKQLKERVFPPYYKREYDDALYVANHNMKNNKGRWEELKNSYNVSTPEEYATAIANAFLISMQQPRAASMPFQQPPPGTYGGV
jgi:23S rRNA U2552 (ribose-2'-O)-methylase RlmE/FtsJ